MEGYLMDNVDYAIIGGGLNGLAAAYRLLEKYPDKIIVVLEKNKYLGEEQSGRNSGVIHSGYQYDHTTLKGKLCVKANSMLKEFAQEHGVPYATVGKMIVATNDEEEKRLDFYYQRARAGGVSIDRLTRDEIKKYEPQVEGQAALYTKDTGVIDAATYVRTLEKLVEQKGGFILTNTPVEDVTPRGDGFILHVNEHGTQYTFQAEIVINAAGLYADTLARKVNPEFPHIVKALRGEFAQFKRKSRPEIMTNATNIYPVPKPIPGMLDQYGNPKTMAGTHLTPTFEIGSDGQAKLGNRIIVGPLAQLVQDKNVYEQGRKPLEAFVADVKPIFPHLRVEDLELDYAGIQVKIQGYDDFVIERDKKYPNFVNVIADTPGMTSSLAISHYLVNEVLRDGKIENSFEKVA